MIDTRIRSDQGYVLGVTLQVILVLLVLGQIVFLASRYRARIDLTEENFYTLTDSTQRVLDSLEDRLQIEAYFSPDSELSTSFAESRRTLRTVLDEYVQNGKGRVSIQYFDPQADNDLRERAERLGIKPQQLNERNDQSMSVKLLWQGLRMRYGGQKQKVLPFLPIVAGQGQPITAPFLYEMTLTPAIKAATVLDKPKIGYIAYPSQGQRGAQNAFNQLRQVPQITERYDLRVISLANGLYIPDDVGTVLLIRPKDLEDRHKYVLDQFLMRGGNLVVFADTDDYSVEAEKMYNRRVIAYDAKDSKSKFLEQLESYGIDVGTTVLLDNLTEAREPMMMVVQTGFGQAMQQVPYPYWFHPTQLDYADYAEKIATDAQGQVDESLAEQYAKSFLPGVDPDLKGLGTPGMFWPCPIGLAEEMPAGVEGRILLRTSPFALETEPPQTLSPFNRVRQPLQQREALNKFFIEIQGRISTEPRRQYGLMAEARGTFSSFFEGKEIPLSPAAQKAKEEAEKKKAEAEGDPLDEGEMGPEPPIDEGEPEPEPDPDPVFAGTAPGRVVAIGDSDFLRDDLVTGQFQQAGGPVSRTGPTFFLNLLDWLAEDQDLFELRNKLGIDRTLKLLTEEEQAGEDLVGISEKLRDKHFWVRVLNVTLPLALLLGFGALVFARRRTAKRSFLKSIEG